MVTEFLRLNDPRESLLHLRWKLLPFNNLKSEMILHIFYCCRILGQTHGTPRWICRKQHFIVPAQTQQTPVQRLSPESKGDLPYIPLQAGYRIKKQGLTHTWLHATLLWVQCYVTFFTFRFFKFYPSDAIPSLVLH
jgi:hypothetical protein